MIAQGAEWHGYNYVLDNEPDLEDLTAALADFMGVYCQTAALLAADWYNSRDTDSRFFASPISVVPPKRATDTAVWAFRVLNPSPMGLAKRVAAATYSMTFDAARDTVSGNAATEGVAYVRVEEPGACDDCAQRATNRPKARNSSSEDVAWDRHQRCEFLFEPVRKGIWVPPDHAREWAERIKEARLAGNSNEQDIANWLGSH